MLNNNTEDFSIKLLLFTKLGQGDTILEFLKNKTFFHVETFLERHL